MSEPTKQLLLSAARELIDRYPAFRDDPDEGDKAAWDKLKQAVEVESRIDLNDRGSLEKALCGALRQSISAHGDITYMNAPSAAKRIIGAIKQWNKQQTPKSNE